MRPEKDRATTSAPLYPDQQDCLMGFLRDATDI